MTERLPGETQIEFELRVLHGRRLGAILVPPDPTQPTPTPGTAPNVTINVAVREFQPGYD